MEHSYAWGGGGGGGGGGGASPVFTAPSLNKNNEIIIHNELSGVVVVSI